MLMSVRIPSQNRSGFYQTPYAQLVVDHDEGHRHHSGKSSRMRIRMNHSKAHAKLQRCFIDEVPAEPTVRQELSNALSTDYCTA